MPIELVMPPNLPILCSPILLLPSIFPSIRVFSNELALRIRWPEYWSFSFNISPFSEYSGLISFRMDWLDLPAVQGTLKSLLQHHSSKASVLRCSAFFIVQLSHPYMTTGETIALTRGTFVDKVMSLLFNRLGAMRIPQEVARLHQQLPGAHLRPSGGKTQENPAGLWAEPPPCGSQVLDGGLQFLWGLRLLCLLF